MNFKFVGGPADGKVLPVDCGMYDETERAPTIWNVANPIEPFCAPPDPHTPVKRESWPYHQYRLTPLHANNSTFHVYAERSLTQEQIISMLILGYKS